MGRFYQPVRVQNQSDAAVAQNGAAGDAVIVRHALRQRLDDPLLNEVSQVLRQNPGQCTLFINLSTPEKNNEIIRSKKLKVKPSAAMISQLRNLVGQENVWMDR